MTYSRDEIVDAAGRLPAEWKQLPETERLSVVLLLAEFPSAAFVAESQFDGRAGGIQRDRAIAQVDRAADPDLKEQMYAILRELVRRQHEVTSDDVAFAAEQQGLPTFEEPRAYGPIMLRAARKGLIARTERTVLSARKQAHRRPIRVWESQVCTMG